MTRRKHYKTSVRRIKTLHTSLQRNDKYSICLWHTLYVIIGLYVNEDLTTARVKIHAVCRQSRFMGLPRHQSRSYRINANRSSFNSYL